VSGDVLPSSRPSGQEIIRGRIGGMWQNAHSAARIGSLHDYFPDEKLGVAGAFLMPKLWGGMAPATQSETTATAE
jgi:hypothetical protein